MANTSDLGRKRLARGCSVCEFLFEGLKQRETIERNEEQIGINKLIFVEKPSTLFDLDQKSTLFQDILSFR